MSGKQHSPASGKESVWDYPRPPKCEPCSREIVVLAAGQQIARSTNTHRVLETSHPPVYYIPPDDIQMDLLLLADRTSWCEWKGRAVYYSLPRHGQRVIVAWAYPEPSADYASIQDHLAFYPDRVDQCLVDGEAVRAQPGDFYGGWITNDIVGPFKGAPGTMGW